MFTTVASAASLIEGGQLRALAVTSVGRSPAFPDLPTVAEAGVPGYAAESWYGLFAPAKTPADVIDRLNRSAATAVQSEAFKRLGETRASSWSRVLPKNSIDMCAARRNAGAR
jgi:tripartite-type tricarboxylate transporter receptor subunit TctC